MKTDKPLKSQDLLIARLKDVCGFPTKKETERILELFTDTISDILVENAGEKSYILKVQGLGSFTVRKRPGSLRRIPQTDEMRQTKPKYKIRFSPLGKLRRLEKTQILDDPSITVVGDNPL